MKPDDLEPLDLQTSFNMFSSEDEEEIEGIKDSPNKSKGFMRWIIIEYDSYTNYFIQAIYRLMCMFSGYFYFYLAAFGVIEYPYLNEIHWTLEALFGLKVILTFTTEWLDAQKEIKYSTHYQIFHKYINSLMFYKEVIPLLPFELLPLGQRAQMFYLIKAFRITIGFELFNHQVLMKWIKQ